MYQKSIFVKTFLNFFFSDKFLNFQTCLLKAEAKQSLQLVRFEFKFPN